MNPDTPNREQLELWLSKPRFARYLKATKGDGELALELYIWNTGLSQAVLKDVSFFEIALRNAYSRCFDENRHGKDRWLFNDTSPLRKPILRKNKRKALVDANRINRKSIDRLAGNLGADATLDNVIANLTLGFWTHLSDRNHECGIPNAPARTITWDQGMEMARHASLTEETGVRIHFCDPHSPWQRETNENTNGLIHDYFPNGTDFSKVTDGEIREMQDQLNGRPRQTLGWKKPAEAYAELLEKAAQGAFTA